MMEALKSAFSKSKISKRRLLATSPSSSCSSRRGRLSKYGFLTPPTTCSTSGEPHPLRSASLEEFRASFHVKFIGSGLVSHHTDFGGCQQVMDSLTASRRKKKDKSNTLIITFTASTMITTNAGGQSRTHVCNLEKIFVVHPHPTKEREFGLISDHTSSGSLKCFCYMTLDGNTGTDVLLSFREACSIWVRERQWMEESKFDLRSRYLSDFTIPDEGSETDQGSSVFCETQSSTTNRRVSFAPTLNVPCETPHDEARKKFKSCIDEMHSSSLFLQNALISDSTSSTVDIIDFGEFGGKCVYYKKPQLPPKNYPPPSSPLTLHQVKTSMQQETESDSDFESDIIPNTLDHLKLQIPTYNSVHTDYREIEDFDFIKEESLFRNFSRSLSAPCLSYNNEEMELLSKYSRNLYRHANVHDSESSASSIEDIDSDTSNVQSHYNNCTKNEVHSDHQSDCCLMDENTFSATVTSKLLMRDIPEMHVDLTVSGELSPIAPPLITFSSIQKTGETYESDDSASADMYSQHALTKFKDFATDISSTDTPVTTIPPSGHCFTSRNTALQFTAEFNASLCDAIIKSARKQGIKFHAHYVVSLLDSCTMSQLINLSAGLLCSSICQQSALSNAIIPSEAWKGLWLNFVQHLLPNKTNSQPEMYDRSVHAHLHVQQNVLNVCTQCKAEHYYSTLRQDDDETKQDD